MRVLVAVYGSVGGSPSGHGTVVRFEGGVIDAATEVVRLGGCRCREGSPLAVLIDGAGTTVWSAKVVNDEGAILEAISAVLARAELVVWAVDVTGTMSVLLLALLAAHIEGNAVDSAMVVRGH